MDVSALGSDVSSMGSSPWKAATNRTGAVDTHACEDLELFGTVEAEAEMLFQLRTDGHAGELKLLHNEAGLGQQRCGDRDARRLERRF